MTEKEKIEELLKPRYKVIATYPGCPYHEGELIEFAASGNVFKGIETKDAEHWVLTSALHTWCANFKKLEWWEEREEKDMPEYIKPIRAQQYVFKVYTVVEDSINFENRNGGFSIEKLSVFLPATKEEYNNQKEEIKKQ